MSKGKRFLFPLILPLLALLALSCSLPQDPVDPASLAAPLAVDTDVSRSQGVFLDEKGVPVDILSYEEEEGRTVKCVEAVGVVPVSQASSAMSLKGGNGFQVKALVLGVRDDGKPGVWEIASDDSVHPVFNWKGKKSSCLPDSEDRDGGMRGLFGWNYLPIAIRTDGAGTALIVGEAVNDGYKHGRRWSIEKGTTVGVYWKLELGSHRHFVLASPARVIGIGLEQAAFHHWKPRPPRGRSTLVLSSLNLFLLDYYEDYLVDLTVTTEEPDNQEVFYWDAKAAVYGVKGKNKNLDPVIAKISREDVITFATDEPPGDGTYARIVIDTYEPHGGFPNAFPADTFLTLYGLKDGLWEELTTDDDGNTDSGQTDSSRIDIRDLGGGQYFLKVTLGPKSNNTGAYAVRALSVDVGAGLPAYPAAFDIASDPYENRDAPEEMPPLSIAPVGIKLGVNNLGRILDPAADVDWILVELPTIISPIPATE